MSNQIPMTNAPKNSKRKSDKECELKVCREENTKCLQLPTDLDKNPVNPVKKIFLTFPIFYVIITEKMNYHKLQYRKRGCLRLLYYWRGPTCRKYRGIERGLNCEMEG